MCRHAFCVSFPDHLFIADKGFGGLCYDKWFGCLFKNIFFMFWISDSLECLHCFCLFTLYKCSLKKKPQQTHFNMNFKVLCSSFNHLCQFWVPFFTYWYVFKYWSFYFSTLWCFIIFLGIIDIMSLDVFCENVEFYCSRWLICLRQRSPLLPSLPF